MANSSKLVLVTGGSGFVASHCIVQLLQKGYQVRTTIRDISKKEDAITALKNGGISSFENLSFITADLTNDANWDIAAQGCDYVLHVASPIGLAIPKSENETILPAVNGTLRVLKAARNAGVKRVVMTSNFGAVGYSHTDTSKIITEESWTNPEEKKLSTYNKSKVLAERAAWNFIHTEGGNLEFAVINPVGVFGPSLSEKLSSGFELLLKLLDGSMKAVPNMTISIVDVRDLADLHLRAMTNPAANGQRFLALSPGVLTMPIIARLLKTKRSAVSQKVSTKVLPNWLVHIAALFSPLAKNIVPQLGRYREASNQKAITMLGWSPRTSEEALLASVDSLIKFKKI
jgi:nucleoside-diphosphate-sugar epimerase